MGDERRTDRMSRVMDASADVVYRAFVDPDALMRWLPPPEMEGRLFHFDARPGGTYRMALTYRDPAAAGSGKTSDATDVVEGTFVELVPGERVVQVVTFESDDPAFAGEMRMTWSLAPDDGGTRVTITCEDVPPGIAREDHEAGLAATLANLAAYVGGHP